MLFIRIVIILLMLSSCSYIESEKSSTELTLLYNSFIHKLSKIEYKLIKCITREGSSDTIDFEHLNWAQDIKFLTELNISKSSVCDYKMSPSQNSFENKVQKNSKKHTFIRYKYLDCNNKLIPFIDLIKS